MSDQQEFKLELPPVGIRPQTADPAADAADDPAPDPGATPAAGKAPPADPPAAEHGFGIEGKPGPLHRMMDFNFMQYASYVICERAIPALEDGLKPVQRRILHALKEKDDGRFIKVANVVGHTMQYHPHGDAAIGEALVNLANKQFLIERQGNFGNIFTGDPAAAPRYIECRLTDLAREEIFAEELTEYVDTYDRRNREPVRLPARIPLLLMLGADGIAVGLSTRIPPHNFRELLEAQIAILQKKPFRLLPDFPQGGRMDVAEYDDGFGTLRLRARIDIRKQSLVITEIPAGTTTESVIASIEDAIRKKKVPVRSITDYTAEQINIELELAADAKPARAIQALYAFTDCEVKFSTRPVVLHEGRPAEMRVSEMLKVCTRRFLQLLERQLKHQQGELEDAFHQKTLVQIFIENRVYKQIETCTTYEAVVQAVLEGLAPFRHMLKRDVSKKDVEYLLEVRIRRISQFDINKNRREIDDIVKELDAVQKNLANLKAYAIRYLRNLLKKHADPCPRMTEVATFQEIEVRALTANELTLAYDRANGYLGFQVEGEPVLTCSSLDKISLIWDDGQYRVIAPPEKLFVDKNLLDIAVYDRDRVMTLVYFLDPFHFIKRFTLGGIILNKAYRCTPPDARVVLLTIGTPARIYVRYKEAKRQRINQQRFEPGDTPVSTPRAKGIHMTAKAIDTIATDKPKWWDDADTSPKGRLG